MASDGQLLASAIVFEITPVKMLGQSEMGFARVRAQTAKRLNRAVSQIQAIGCVIQRSDVELVVRVRELVIRKSERWVAL